MVEYKELPHGGYSRQCGGKVYRHNSAVLSRKYFHLLSANVTGQGTRHLVAGTLQPLVRDCFISLLVLTRLHPLAEIRPDFAARTPSPQM